MKPRIRFKDFHGDWIIQRIGSIAEKVNSGKTPLGGETAYTTEGILFIRSQNVVDDRLSLEDVKYISEDINSSMKNSVVCAGDILLNITGASLGRSCVVPPDFSIGNVNQHVCIIRLSEGYDPYFLQPLFSSDKGQRIFHNLQTGSGREGLNFQSIRSISVAIPSFSEQQKIASFLSAVDTKIQQLTRKKELLEQYKKGVMQKIFKREIRFKDEQGREYPEWEEKKLSEVLYEHKTKSRGTEEVYSVSVHKGLVNQIEHLGRSFAAESTLHYNLVKSHDIVYTKSPTGDFPYGIIKQSWVDENVIVSPLYGVFTPETPELGYMLHVYFESTVNVYNYLHSIIQKGAKNTINITNDTFLSKNMVLPRSIEEQRKIGAFFKELDRKISGISLQIDQVKKFKKGLLQQMFV